MRARPAVGLRVVFRCDASCTIGYGHVSRCLTVGAAFVAAGADVRFVMRDLDQEVSQRVESSGHGIVRLRDDADEIEDLRVTLNACQAVSSCLITDSHVLSEAFYARVRSAGVPLVSFDDFAGVAYASDLVINHNIGAEKLRYSVGPHTRLLLGPRYLPLRRPFRHLLGQPRPIRQQVGAVVVSLGGMPETESASIILEGLRDWADAGRVEVTIVAGVRAPAGAVRTLREGLPSGGRVLVDPDLPRLLFGADLAVVNGSVTAYEAAALGTPLIVTAVSENQRAAVAEFCEAGVAAALPNVADLTPAAVARLVAAVAADRDRRTEFSARGRALVDGAGTDRIVEETLAVAVGTRTGT